MLFRLTVILALSIFITNCGGGGSSHPNPAPATQKGAAGNTRPVIAPASPITNQVQTPPAKKSSDESDDSSGDTSSESAPSKSVNTDESAHTVTVIIRDNKGETITSTAPTAKDSVKAAEKAALKEEGKEFKSTKTQLEITHKNSSSAKVESKTESKSDDKKPTVTNVTPKIKTPKSVVAAEVKAPAIKTTETTKIVNGQAVTQLKITKIATPSPTKDQQKVAVVAKPAPAKTLVKPVTPAAPKSKKIMMAQSTPPSLVVAEAIPAASYRSVVTSDNSLFDLAEVRRADIISAFEVHNEKSIKDAAQISDAKEESTVALIEAKAKASAAQTHNMNVVLDKSGQVLVQFDFQNVKYAVSGSMQGQASAKLYRTHDSSDIREVSGQIICVDQGKTCDTARIRIHIGAPENTSIYAIYHTNNAVGDQVGLSTLDVTARAEGQAPSESFDKLLSTFGGRFNVNLATTEILDGEAKGLVTMISDDNQLIQFTFPLKAQAQLAMNPVKVQFVNLEENIKALQGDNASEFHYDLANKLADHTELIGNDGQGHLTFSVEHLSSEQSNMEVMKMVLATTLQPTVELGRAATLIK